MVKISPPSLRMAAAFGGLALACLIIAFVPAPVTSGDWAAWVQGTGTVLAVGLVTWTRSSAAPAAARDQGRATDRRTEQLEQAVSSLHRAATDLELAIWDGDFRRVRDGIALVGEGQAWVSLKRLLHAPAGDWPSQGLRARALEIRQAVIDLAQLLPEPEPEPGNDEALTAWWEALKVAVARLGGVANSLLKDIDRG